MNEAASTPLPEYVSHKRVWALKIAEIIPIMSDPDEGEPKMLMVRLLFEDKRFASKDLGMDYALRIKAGADQGYYVKYADGFESWSPTKAFEEGYRRYTVHDALGISPEHAAWARQVYGDGDGGTKE